MKRLSWFALMVFAIFTITACGGGGGSSSGPSTATGYFKDSNVAGMAFNSGGQSGVTDQYGRFTYEVGQPVTFSIGSVTVGTTTGAEIVTPIDLVTNGTTQSTEVQNIVRFLMTIDSDGDPTNGINISTEIQTAAALWSQVDFSTSDLNAALTDIVASCNTADGGSHSVPDASTAQSHIESTLRCAHSGAYAGFYAGDDRGTFGVLIDTRTGYVTGITYSEIWDDYSTLTGSSPLSYDQSAAFISGSVGNGATFNGEFEDGGIVVGTWSNSSDGTDGTFSGNRIGGLLTAAYRFTGQYSGSDNGLFAFDVDASDNVTGIAYSLYDDETTNLTGSLSGTTLTATTANGATVAGTLNKATGDLSGTWSNGADAGTFTGCGCKLN